MAGVRYSGDQLKQLTVRNPSLKVGVTAPAADQLPASVAHASSDAIVFDIEPMGAPRQVRSDKWKSPPRPCIARYRVFKDYIRARSAEVGYELGGVLRVRFEISMPASWPKKKKEAMRGKPHQQKIDCDNGCKALMDAYNEDDSHVHTIIASKVWADTGRIIIYP